LVEIVAFEKRNNSRSYMHNGVLKRIYTVLYCIL